MHIMKVKKAAVIYPRVMFGFSLLITLSCCSRERGKKTKKKPHKEKLRTSFIISTWSPQQLSYPKKYFKGQLNFHNDYHFHLFIASNNGQY